MSRHDKQVMNIIANEDPTECGFCGARTGLIETHADHTLEQCLNGDCGQRFDVYKE
ncbi:MAG: hypothetical protein M3O74_13855 [Pseudomonadota bacterium]|nr:hypothetical protein [Pseudomonadota bacterium]